MLAQAVHAVHVRLEGIRSRPPGVHTSVRVFPVVGLMAEVELLEGTRFLSWRRLAASLAAGT